MSQTELMADEFFATYSKRELAMQAAEITNRLTTLTAERDLLARKLEIVFHHGIARAAYDEIAALTALGAELRGGVWCKPCDGAAGNVCGRRWQGVDHCDHCNDTGWLPIVPPAQPAAKEKGK
jgi:hypothetical protein